MKVVQDEVPASSILLEVITLTVTDDDKGLGDDGVGEN